MLPNEDHPLTLAYLAGARSREHEPMRQAMRLIQSLERDASELLLAQCRLAADVLLERSRE